MSWTAPMTAIAGSVFTAAQWNTHIRDNLAETEVAKATQVSAFCVVTGTNQLGERVPATDGDLSTETTTSTTYTDLEAGAGPSLSLLTGTHALVSVYGSMSNSSGNAAWIGFEVSGASALPAADSLAVQFNVTTPDTSRTGAVFLIDTLTPGVNIFTMKYRVSISGTGTFANRRLSVVPF